VFVLGRRHPLVSSGIGYPVADARIGQRLVNLVGHHGDLL